MAKQNLASMSVDAMLKLRDEIGMMLSRKADELKKELRALGEDYKEVGRIAIYGKKKGPKPGGKVAPKYRDPATKETWAGRGGMPRWMRAALKSGKKREDFLIIKASRKTKKATKAKRR